MYQIEKFEELIKQAKLHKSIPLLEEIHICILEALQYMQVFKKGNRRDETYHLNNEIHKLEDLNIRDFKAFSQIQQNSQFSNQKINNKQIRK